ncbi:uncharacterized protein LOC108733738 isoform X2 [Agrilus planipennis]|uniref:Uncharacterized protein LOC108733738 isoform X2 n=1 Tax=Agrilus planipennis TaxID=224129 RepID=A0A1W4WK85_AGRPL|nr:uncharacterized protein LOC108733738 isoform X2 [Agrilus planipennis]
MWLECDWILQILTGAILSQFVSFYLNTSVKNNDRHNLSFLSNCFSKYIFATACLLISVVVVPLLIAVVILCTLYRGLVYVILKAKYKEKFKGFVAGRDVIWLVEEPQSRNIVVALLLVEEVEGMSKSVYETVKEAILNETQYGSLKDTKLVYSFHKSLGYFYNIDEGSLSDECIVEFDTDDPAKQFINRGDLEKKLSMYCNNPLPQNHTRYCEILVSKKPIIWKEADTKKNYPIIVRIHHSLGDGFSIFNFINSTPFTIVEQNTIKDGNTNSMNDNGISSKKDQYCNEKMSNKIKTLATEYIKMITSFLIFITFLPNCIIVQNFLRPKDVNILHGPKLSGRKKFYWNTEDREELVPLIRRLKRKVTGSCFNDFIMTAFSASLHEYFQKKTKELPKYITGVVPTKIDFKQDRTEKVTFTNNFAVALFNMPVEISNDTLIQRFRETALQEHRLRDSIDFHINYWGLTFNAVIPVFLVHYFYQLSKFTSFISVLPGPDAFSFFNVLPVTELLYWLPNRGYEWDLRA